MRHAILSRRSRSQISLQKEPELLLMHSPKCEIMVCRVHVHGLSLVDLGEVALLQRSILM